MMKRRTLVQGACATGLTLALGLGGRAPHAHADEAAGASVDGRFTDIELASKVCPQVHSYTQSEVAGYWSLGAASRIVVDSSLEGNDRLQTVVKLVNSEIAAKKLLAKPMAMIWGKEADAKAADLFVSLDESLASSGENDAYAIEVSAENVKVSAATENAAMYALRTIMAYHISLGGMPFGLVEDHSDLAERRLFLDCGRKYFTKEWMIAQIKDLSYLRMNAFEVHFGENLGFRLECETDPAILSDEFLTKDEMREVLEAARLYGVEVIPSLDSPGHVTQILKAHPEYGQVSNKGTHFEHGLDVTNPKAVEYMKSLYTEYCDFFKEFPDVCRDFNIGGDEYMEFDRNPFQSDYRSVLDAHAVKTLGEGHDWRDVLTTYLNEVAELVHGKGYNVRMYNDGMYYGENTWGFKPQKVALHQWVEVEHWSQMGWNPQIAKLEDILKRGHDVLYNVNCTFGYYVLRNDKPNDGRPQASFDHLDPDKHVYENWSPAKFQANENVLKDDDPRIKGAAMHIWCDNPGIVTEDVVASDIQSTLRVFAARMWKVQGNTEVGFAEFKDTYDALGHNAGYDGSALPEAGLIVKPEVPKPEPEKPQPEKPQPEKPQPEKPQVEKPGVSGGSGSGKKPSRGDLPQTGDPALAGIATAAFSGAVLSAAALKVRKGE